MRLVPHETTTAQLGAAYPFVSSRPLRCSGVLVGRDLYGTHFSHDPFELYANGELTNPNALVLGQVGRGKSALVKCYLFRHAAFGRRIVVLDPKGEYGAFAAALGTEPVALRPGGSLRLNPLDITTAPTEVERERRLIELALLSASSCSARELSPKERVAIELAVRKMQRSRARPSLAGLIEALLSPDERDACEVGSRVAELRDDAPDVAFELRRFVYGELRGMFDGESTAHHELDRRVLVLDLSALYHSASLATLLSLCAAFLERFWRSDSGEQTILVIDEAWAVLTDLAATRFFQASFKLARANGVANIAVVHRLSDLSASGGDGSLTAKLATGLLSDCETVVCYRQEAAELEATTKLLGLSDTESRLLGHLGRGVGLWRVAGRPFVVEHRLSRAERVLVDTDRALVGSKGATTDARRRT